MTWLILTDVISLQWTSLGVSEVCRHFALIIARDPRRQEERAIALGFNLKDSGRAIHHCHEMYRSGKWMLLWQCHSLGASCSLVSNWLAHDRSSPHKRHPRWKVHCTQVWGQMRTVSLLSDLLGTCFDPHQSLVGSPSSKFRVVCRRLRRGLDLLNQLFITLFNPQGKL